MTAQDKANLNPRPPAVFAMYHWPTDYAAQRGGVMDFFNSLHPRDQKYCTEAAMAIVASALKWRALLREGRKASQKPVPRLKLRTEKRKP